MRSKVILVVMVATLLVCSTGAQAAVVMDFVTIGNAGNAADSTSYGAVDYNYRIGKYEVTNSQWDTFVSAAGAPTGNPSSAYDESAYYTGGYTGALPPKPTNEVSWYEAAQFCNFLTSGDKSKGAYLFSGNNSNAGDFLGIDRAAAMPTYGIIYVIPTEDEWYKAAYYKPDGSGYSLYANGLNTIPAADNGWNYDSGSYEDPWDVGTGTEEQNGTFDMMGNLWEYNEALIPDAYSSRGMRGGSFITDDGDLGSSQRKYSIPDGEYPYLGFRVASVPEPATLLLLGLGAVILRRKR